MRQHRIESQPEPVTPLIRDPLHRKIVETPSRTLWAAARRPPRHFPIHLKEDVRNGAIGKVVQTGVGPVPLRVPRDRAGSFEPILIPKP
jgi:transposase-like protein